MIEVFYGDDRVGVERAIRQQFGDDFETIEAENLSVFDLDSVFYGGSLFTAGMERKIVIKNLSENKECFARISRYFDTSHAVILWESTLDKRSVTVKTLVADKRVGIKEFKLAPLEASQKDRFYNFKIFEMAYRGEVRQALKMCEEVERTVAPQLVLGAWTTSACKELERSGTEHKRGARAGRALKVLAETDLKIKSADLDGWALLKAALIKIGVQEA